VSEIAIASQALNLHHYLMPETSRTSAPTELLAGLVDRVTFHNPENGFCVLRIAPGLTVNDVGGFEHDSCAIAMDRLDLRRPREIRARAGGELGIEFDRRHPARGADQLRKNWR
jgi:hypothetical protein